jgi:hypothetical protein
MALILYPERLKILNTLPAGKDRYSEPIIKAIDYTQPTALYILLKNRIQQIIDDIYPETQVVLCALFIKLLLFFLNAMP